MGFGKALFFLFTCCFLLLEAESKCQRSYPCSNFSLEFPFTDGKDPECGLFPVYGCHPNDEYRYPRADIGYGHHIDIQGKPSGNSFLGEDFYFQGLLNNRSCFALTYESPLMSNPSVSFTFSPNFTFFTCSNEPYITGHFKDYKREDCDLFNVFYKNPANGGPSIEDTSHYIPHECSVVQLPKSNVSDPVDLFDLLSSELILEWSVSEACSKCYRGGGQCLTDNQNKFICKQDKSRLKLILALSVSGSGILMLLLIAYIIWLRKEKSIRGYIRSRNISSSKSDIEGGIFYFGIPVFSYAELEEATNSFDPSKELGDGGFGTVYHDIEGGIFYFGIPVFSYAELEEATNSFDPSKELGDGGFGTVYHGKLRDGREVAIKRMYEHNFKRVEQFLNEIKILTAMRHPNLVSLYGCTSRTSRELLLVYEYISNGTVADHLHGERANEAPLAWPIRMKIAIETATALAYLHKSDIIHRDVKTNNILLDSNNSVKVADFGISRLFPNDVTHISTAPQGTPGYVDPEYHQCYQLTDKSDVYSFGVVLIELISSMPAVDVTRDRHEINLANLALNRIQRCAFDELIDSSLGYESDPEVTRMTTTVAELAFRCLQVDKDLRPSMDEVLDFLKDIQGGEVFKFEQRKQGNGIQTSPESDDVLLLKNKVFHSSPMAVADAWPSSASTFTSSVE